MSESRDERRLLLVRHGLPDYRAGKRGDVPPGPYLSAIGHDQARQAARIVAAYEPQTIHVSPYQRTRQTAAHLQAACRAALRVDPDLQEWSQTDGLYQVNVRQERWLRRWLSGAERCAVAVSHGSPIIGMLRAALYLPHRDWYSDRRVERLRVDAADRFEVSMASVFELRFIETSVTCRCLFHPAPRVMKYKHGRIIAGPRRPTGVGERIELLRPRWGMVAGANRRREFDLAIIAEEKSCQTPSS